LFVKRIIRIVEFVTIHGLDRSSALKAWEKWQQRRATTADTPWTRGHQPAFRQGDVGIVRGADAALRVECVGVRGIAACCSQEVGLHVARPSGKQ